MAQDNDNSNNGGKSSGGRVWLITGCSSGFGRAIAEAVLAHGDSVLATARNPNDLAELEKAAGDNAERMAKCRLDVTSPDQCLAAVEFAAETFGKLDVLVNNAGYGLLGGLEELNDDEIEQQFDVNFFGPLRLMRKALHHWRTTGTGGASSTWARSPRGIMRWASPCTGRRRRRSRPPAGPWLARRGRWASA